MSLVKHVKSDLTLFNAVAVTYAFELLLLIAKLPVTSNTGLCFRVRCLLECCQSPCHDTRHFNHVNVNVMSNGLLGLPLPARSVTPSGAAHFLSVPPLSLFHVPLT